MTTTPTTDIAVIGAGAAGLMTGIIAARANPHRRVILLDGAKKLGAKILVAGGGRCNVTHHRITAKDYAGSTPKAIQKVLRRFSVSQTIAFFEDIGVPLRQEATGKLFPTTDRASTVLDALLQAAQAAQAEIWHPNRIDWIQPQDGGFLIGGNWGELHAQKVVLATGGQALPKSGSDGGGYALAQTLGHTLTTRIFPALVPLALPKDHILRTLKGISAEVDLSLRAGTGKKLHNFTDSMLCTHVGISGPAAMNISRYWAAARYDDPGVYLTVNWLPHRPPAALDATLQALGRRSVLAWLSDHLPERLGRAICTLSELAPSTHGDHLPRVARLALLRNLTEMPLPISGDRGWNYAEVTAGGVPLHELDLKTMASRKTPGLYLCGEICDVDGRIGGFNFQWAWASGYVAGTAI